MSDDVLIQSAPATLPPQIAAPATRDAADPVRLPRNIEAEAAFLGALLIDNRIAEETASRLKPEHFFENIHARLYAQIMRLIDSNVTVTPVTLKPFFEGDAALAELGGMRYVARLTGEAAGLIGARDFARQIYDLALLRELIQVGRTLVDKAMDTSETVDPMGQIELAEAALYNVAQGEGESGAAVEFKAASKTALGMVEKALNSGGHISGVTTGLTDLNAKIGGLHPSDLLILAGRPGMGKTSLATNIAFNAAARWQLDKASGIDDDKNVGARTAFFSLEMSSDQLATRILAEQSRISSEKLRMGQIARSDFQRLVDASQALEELPLYIDDTPALTIAALRARARRLKRKHNIGFIVVDYLQLLQGTGRNEGRVNEISEISRGLKTLAKELQVPVMALSQLSRAVESREDKRPQLSDLRESGSIEQDADIVMFIYREEYYRLMVKPDGPIMDPKTPQDDEINQKYKEWEDKFSPTANKATVIVAKQRHGSTGNVQLRFESEITKFSDLARDEYAPGGFGE
ncbi:replicative DNA helicase [Blastomonas sp.]|uniref:replicative DNA helicase n=1 Tax=Blastomonas sp. TaxID=1909299 RepID=UPI0035933784